ncbi:MAG: hypothetical protein AAF962_27750 [Actinomycetota bacterium]
MVFQLPVIEQSVLSAVAKLTKGGSSATTAADVIHQLEREGFGQFVTVLALRQMAATPCSPLPVIETLGNLGPDWPPAELGSVSLGLTPAGRVVVEEGSAIPILLLHGSLGLGGTFPPFTLQGVLDSLKLAQDDRRLTNSAFTKALGAFNLPTRPHVEGNLRRLLTGKRQQFQLSIALERNESVISIQGISPFTSAAGLRHELEALPGLERIEVGSNAWLAMLTFESQESAEFAERKFANFGDLHTTVHLDFGRPPLDLAKEWLAQLEGRAVEDALHSIAIASNEMRTGAHRIDIT